MFTATSFTTARKAEATRALPRLAERPNKVRSVQYYSAWKRGGADAGCSGDTLGGQRAKRNKPQAQEDKYHKVPLTRGP